MFPWVCMATMPLFYPFDWPKMIITHAEKTSLTVKGGIRNYLNKFKCTVNICQRNITKLPEKNIATEEKTVCDSKNVFKNDIAHFVEEVNKEANSTNGNMKKTTLALIIFHVVAQAFLPYSHFITKVRG